MARLQSSLSVFVLFWSLASAFRAGSVPTQKAPSFLARSGSVAMASTQADSGVETTAASARPPRVVPESLPTLYVYDHCPFCVRVRFALGLKNIKHRLHFLGNDDVITPTNLVGKKIAPIMQWKPDGSSDEIVMAESLDIIKLMDENPALGAPLLLPSTGRTDIKAWQKDVRDLLRALQRPRYVATGLLPEFQQLDGRHAFVMNHPLPGYEKPEWKENIPMQERLSLYAEAMAKDPAADIEELNRKLVELDDIICSENYCSPGGLSYDDIDLFARLRSITIIRDVQWPTKLRGYMDRMSEMGDVPLYDEMAL